MGWWQAFQPAVPRRCWSRLESLPPSDDTIRSTEVVQIAVPLRDADGDARQEIHRLDKYGVLGPRTVLVHGIGFDASGFELIRRRGASLSTDD